MDQRPDDKSYPILIDLYFSMILEPKLDGQKLLVVTLASNLSPFLIFHSEYNYMHYYSLYVLGKDKRYGDDRCKKLVSVKSKITYNIDHMLGNVHCSANCFI